jgi:hypothetical protein
LKIEVGGVANGIVALGGTEIMSAYYFTWAISTGEAILQRRGYANGIEWTC